MTTDEVIEAALPAAQAIAAEYFKKFPRLGFDELRSLAIYAVVKAAPRYDDTKGTTPAQYMRERVKGEIVDYIRKLNGSRRIGRVKVLQFYADPEWELNRDSAAFLTALTVRDGCFERVNDSEAASVLFRRAELSARELYVITEFFWHDRPATEICRSMGVHESRVSQLKNRALRKLRQALFSQ